jgi:hypothetical protein
MRDGCGQRDVSMSFCRIASIIALLRMWISPSALVVADRGEEMRI